MTLYQGIGLVLFVGILVYLDVIIDWMRAIAGLPHIDDKFSTLTEAEQLDEYEHDAPYYDADAYARLIKRRNQ